MNIIEKYVKCSEIEESRFYKSLNLTIYKWHKLKKKPMDASVSNLLQLSDLLKVNFQDLLMQIIQEEKT